MRTMYDKDFLLDQSLLRLPWTFSSMRLLFLDLLLHLLIWICLFIFSFPSFSKNPVKSVYRESSTLGIYHPWYLTRFLILHHLLHDVRYLGLPSARILLGQFRKTHPTTVVIFHPLTPTPLCFLAMNPHFSLFYSELRSMSLPYWKPWHGVPWIKVSLTSLTSVRIHFELTYLRLNHSHWVQEGQDWNLRCSMSGFRCLYVSALFPIQRLIRFPTKIHTQSHQ